MMDIFGKQSAPLQQRDSLGNRPTAWPTVRAQRGRYYALPDPIHAGDQLVVMSMETWVDYGTQMETIRRAGVEMDARIKDLIGENRTLAAQAAQWKDKLEHIQSIRRKEQIAKAYKSHGVTHDHVG